MQLPLASRKHAGPRVACSEPPPLDGVTPTLALLVVADMVAPHASTTPDPVAEVLPPGNWRALAISRCLTWFGDNHGDLPSISAAAPDTMPVENDVPEPFP